MQKDDFHDPIHDVNETVSCSECTGIMPASPNETQSAANCAELYSIHPPQGPKGQKRPGAKNS